MFSIIQFGTIRIITFPIILTLGILFCFHIFIKSRKFNTFYFSTVLKVSIYGAISALLGGKLVYFIVMYIQGSYGIWNMVNGFVFYGGLIGGVLGIIFFCIFHHQRILDYTDLLACFLPLGQAIGRIGCYFNGCCYGREYHGVGSINYLIDGHIKSVFPTQFMESIFCFVIFLGFFIIGRRLYSGIYSALYLTLYCPYRFIAEFYRGDVVRGVWNIFSTSQIISVPMFCLGIILYIYIFKKERTNLIITGRIKNECKSVSI